MEKNLTLREFYIGIGPLSRTGANEIQEEGGNAVATGILRNHSITTLDLGSPALTPS